MNDDIPSPTDATDRGLDGRYSELQLEAGAVIIYDRTRTSAWIQSNVTIPVEAATDDPTVPESD